VVTYRNSLTLSSAALVLMLAVLTVTVGLDPVAVLLGAGCGCVLGVAVGRGLARSPDDSLGPDSLGLDSPGPDTLGPGDLVTLTRAILACGIAALVVQSFRGPLPVGVLVVLAAVALILDAIDGLVARRTGTVSAFGARFDGEADAFLMLVLSVYVAQSWGVWVLAIGAARYVFAVAGWFLAWLRRDLPFRYWRKVVTAVQGIVLTYAAADLGPPALTHAALLVALALLTESFGRDVLWTWRRRGAEGVAAPVPVDTRADLEVRLL
jgi:phosphatidylglycerophosphate synthase